MARILICFASMSVNTEDIADLIKSHLDIEHHIEINEMEDVSVSSLKDYDCVLIGTYTWNDGDLPYEAEEFYEELETEDLNGLPAAVFGSGDRTYPQFCEAVHLLQNQLKTAGSIMIQNGLEIELNPDTDEDLNKCQRFAEEVTNFLKGIEKKCKDFAHPR